jgi:acyl carrier protein
MERLTSEEVLDRVSGIVSDVLIRDVRDITPEKKLKEDLGCDSLDTLDIIVRVERQFRVQISHRNATRICFGTVGELCRDVEGLLGKEDV